MAAGERSSWRPPWLRHPDGVRAVVDGQAGVLGRQDALEDQRQRRPGADLVERVPGQRHAAHVQDLVQLAAVMPCVALGQVRVGVLARVEGAPEDVVPVAQDGRVHGEDERLVAGGRRSLHEAAGHAPVPLDVELEPATRVGSDGGDLLDGPGRDRGHDVDGAGAGRRTRRGQLPVWMSQAVQRGRRDADGRRRGAPQDRRLERDLRHVDEDPRTQPEPVPCAGIGPERVPVPRAALVVGPGGRVEALPGRCLEVVHAHDAAQVDRGRVGRRIGETGSGVVGHGLQDRPRVDDDARHGQGTRCSARSARPTPSSRRPPPRWTTTRCWGRRPGWRAGPAPSDGPRPHIESGGATPRNPSDAGAEA